MPQNTHLELVTSEAERLPEPSRVPVSDSDALAMHAVKLSRNLPWLPNTEPSTYFIDRFSALSKNIFRLLSELENLSLEPSASDDFRWMYDNTRLLSSELENTLEAFQQLKKIPDVRTPRGEVIPRVAAVAEGFLGACENRASEEALSTYLNAFQKDTPLRMRELWALVPALKLHLMEEIARHAPRLLKDHQAVLGTGVCVRSLRELSETNWKEILEPLIAFDRILRQDPAGAYANMEFESRDLYRNRIVKLSDRADCSETEIATAVLKLAREAQAQGHSDPRVALRQSHVGYYLIAEGKDTLHERIGYRPPVAERISSFLRKHPDETYLPAIEVLTLAIVSIILLVLTPAYSSPWLILLSTVALLLPSSQSAVQLVNYLITALLRPQILPKLDFSEKISEDCVTLVAVPSLLLNEAQVHRLAEDLEVRFLGNHDPNLHFALLTDLPDSREPSEEKDARVDLCAQLIEELNKKYATQGMGSFLLLHRHRVYNPREKVWMGWERKRGKLLDLNKLLRTEYDSFPVKVGDLSVLSKVRFVITLDADTELPRESAHRMVGCLAHPLNQAIVDPELNIVVAGYGILQPRVGVSVQSASRSRLASIYSGETGFDIYTRAVSDVYQDLYGEGSFTGKGIYEVETVHRVLDRRFPRNALLSHDLIEGAYARAGLATDVEVIEDYPSHYSAYNRRKHRWLRGDWQIIEWLFPHVPDESGHEVRNPISMVSQWKIFDNLRRSLVEPATFLLFVLGWLVLPGLPKYWTLATIAILFVPAWGQFVFGLIRAIVTNKWRVARDSLIALFDSNINVFLTLTFIAHQTVLSLDAVVRATVRRLWTGQRLLEWETAAEAELGGEKRTPVDRYLDWTPALALLVGVLVALSRREALPSAIPILLLWACSKWVSLWLNRPPTPVRNQTGKRDELFLRQAALRTWRYFSEFCTEEHNWLIPDNVQEEPLAIAARISPTNLGFLLNARQVACELGYLTIPEFVQQNKRTLATVAKLPRYHGHLLNWYDTRTLAPLPPSFISAVDNGNLLASLWTLNQGILERLKRPLWDSDFHAGVLDHLRAAFELRALSRKEFSSLVRHLREDNLVSSIETLEDALGRLPQHSNAQPALHGRWFLHEARTRLHQLSNGIRNYTPWLLPEFAQILQKLGFPETSLQSDKVPLQQIPALIEKLMAKLPRAASNGFEQQEFAIRQFETLLTQARSNATSLIADLEAIAAEGLKLADEMDFAMLLNRRRKLLSVGYDVDAQHLQPACYDLLATESRTAVFVAIAKDDIPQESWFRLGRAHVLDNGRPVLLSWTGTMFEYLMPSLWMRSHPNTLLERSRLSAVLSQQAYTAAKRIPWGISESAYAKTDEAGNYQYHAFGLPNLALRKHETKVMVISPYSSFLALGVDPVAALRNLNGMLHDGWFGAYGFYEAADFTTPRRRRWGRNYELVRCWMAHHQGMSLLAIANFVHDGVVQRWFHAEPRVQATELLLHEKPLSHVDVKDGQASAA
jgi:cyclic beta-1,2-glucan synthetase